MKIVLNTGLNEFVLTDRIKRRIAEIGCPHSSLQSITQVYGSEWLRTMTREGAFNADANLNNITNLGERIVTDMHSDNKLEVRTCPVLVKAVEELARVGFDYHCEVEIVEIPDDIDVAILHLKQGGELAVENRRSWRFELATDSAMEVSPKNINVPLPANPSDTEATK